MLGAQPLSLSVKLKNFPGKMSPHMGRSGEHVNFGVIKSHPNTECLHYRFASGDVEGNFCIPSFPPHITKSIIYRVGYFILLVF